MSYFFRSAPTLTIYTTIKNTDVSLVKNKFKFLPNKYNNSKLNTLFEKLWYISLKEKTTQNNLSH